MGTFFVYILKASFCLGGFYLFYRWLLTRDTFHRFNRIVLLCILLLSLSLPFCRVTTYTYTEVQQTMLSWEQLLMMANFTEVVPVAVPEQVTTLRWLHVVLILYTVGVLFFAGRHLYSIGNLFSLIWRSRKEMPPGKIRLVIHQRELAPFSWMCYIVISEKDLEECGREILAHETAHIKKLHSLDLMLADCCIFFQWFNPASWLLKQELQSIHEYEADEEVLRQGIDAKTYQLLLIKKAVGTRLYSMANSFNHSNLKKRITMMLKEKSSPWARMKCLYAIPVAAIAVTAFARPEVTSVAEEISAVKVSDLSALVETNSVENPLMEISAEGEAILELRIPVVSEPVAHALAVDTGVPSQDPVIFDVVEQMPEFPGGYGAMMKYISENLRYPSAARAAGLQGRVLVQFVVGEDGKVFSPNVVRPVDPELDKEALRVIGEMPTWKPGQQHGKNVTVRFTVPVIFGLDSPGSDSSDRTVVGYGNRDLKPLIVINGKEVEKISELERNDIESINVLKDQSAIEKYGDKGKMV
ncbi:MAG: TonB family protein [Bacteroides sp.]|nr:TonB family protein [Bacteroides sp.]